MRYTLLDKIDPNLNYSIKEILDEKLIPFLNSPFGVYSILTVRTPFKDENGKVKNKFVLRTETDKFGIKPVENWKPNKKISGKLYAKGSDIIKYLHLNGLDGYEVDGDKMVLIKTPTTGKEEIVIR